MAARAQKSEALRPAPVPTAQPKAIASVRLTAPFSYYEEDGTAKNWDHGQIIKDPSEIKHLMERGAHVVPHEVES